MLKDLFSNRLFIGALAFFVLMIVGGTLYLRYIQRQGQIELERTQERLKQWEAQQKQTPKVPEGNTSQGGHVHADGTWHDEPHEMPHTPAEIDTQQDNTSPIVSGSTGTRQLTYHADLLASHPVEALRAQAAERRHWSEKWIPPFPPDDHEAAALARTSYLIVYYRSTGEIDTPKARQILGEDVSLQRAMMDKEYSLPRISDLLRLTWATLQAGDIEEPDYTPSNYPLPLN